MTELNGSIHTSEAPEWVPRAALYYLAHTERG